MQPLVIFVLFVSCLFFIILGICFSYIMELRCKIEEQEHRLNKLNEWQEIDWQRQLDWNRSSGFITKYFIKLKTPIDGKQICD